MHIVSNLRNLERPDVFKDMMPAVRSWSLIVVSDFSSWMTCGGFVGRTQGRLLLAVFSLALAVGSSGCGEPAPAAPAGIPTDELAERVKALEGLIPDQAHIMADVADHFTNLWFAGKSEN
jgi:hypothetical protein